ncbi:zinc-finger protein [Ophidiomyces ophidiicola]|nr:zinc-finger protein [Ophidiomyces ophidiicola]KAI1995683.1 zinc-finger protein [Ophidiomyces ophidiicola]
MSPRPDADPFCLECHWENYHMAESDLLSPSECFDIACWNNSDLGNHLSSCDGPDCCDMDDCARGCADVCDGFVDCDKSTICSEAFCDNSNCQTEGTACFDKDCIGSHYDHDAFLSQSGPLSWDCLSLVPDRSNNCGFHDDGLESALSSHMHSPGTAIPSDISLSLKDLGHNFYANQNSFNSQPHMPPPQCINHNLDAICVSNITDFCHTLGNCAYPHRSANPPSTLGNCSETSAPYASLHSSRTPHHHYHHRYSSLHTLGSQFSRRRLDATPTVTESTRTTPSLSLQSSPVPTSSCRDLNSVGPFDSPDFLGTEELHICRWIAHSSDNAICGAIFPDAGSLQKHLTSVHADPRQGCQGQGYYCCWDGCSRPDEPFSQKSKLQGHFLTHSNYKSFQCSICGKPFARQATLERHERSHRGDKPYKCKECGKKFTDSSELKTHMRTHTGEKPFKCTHPGCTFETGDSSNMSSHKLTHGERKHKCPYPGCSKSFTRPDQLKRHLKGTHKHTNILPVRLTSPLRDTSIPQV